MAKKEGCGGWRSVIGLTKKYYIDTTWDLYFVQVSDSILASADLVWI